MRNSNRFSLLVIVLALFSLPAFAWNCTGNDIRVQVPTGTVGTGTGDAPGNVVVDNGLTFQCQTPPATIPPSTPTTSNSNSTSSANSGSTSSSNATGGNSSSTSKSGVSNSGNSTNTLSNNLALNNTNKSSNTQSQKQGQTQSNSSTNNNQSTGGAVSDVGNSVENIAAPKIPVATADAPPVFSTVNCFKGFSGGAQSAVAGLSFGGGGIDKNCAAERIAQDYYAMGNRLAACKVIITTKSSKAAGVTLEDCMNVLVRPIAVAPPAPVPQIMVIQPQPQIIYIPMPHETVTVVAPAPKVVKPVAPKHAARKIGQPKPCYVIQDQCVVVGHRTEEK